MQKQLIDPAQTSQYQEVNAENIAEFIEDTEQFRVQCEAEGRYVEAEMAKNRVAELKQQDFQRQMEEMAFTHQQQREECEQAHIKQYQEFNAYWDKQLFELSEADQAELNAMDERHTKELEDNRSRLEGKPDAFKGSAELLNLKRIQTNLAKQKNYQEAHQVQCRVQELEEKEREQYNDMRHKQILASEAKLMQKQSNEMAAHKKRLELRMNERLKEREIEHNRILQRYQNVKKEIENQQNLERCKKERAYNVRPQTASKSLMASTSKMGASRMKQSQMGSSRHAPASKPSHMK